ncbi:hypothetical protein E4U49_005139 [Claviceps purpurea]|nr:hypothetical protein E4U49_005139 [Claviceps purpurea]
MTLSPYAPHKTTRLSTTTLARRPPSPDVIPSSDACLVFGNAWASEGIDRPGLSDTYTDTLVKKAASQCNNTMVVLHNAGPRLVNEFADYPNVTAILMAHLPGRETSKAGQVTALVKLLYGEASPSGKLPYTLARNASVYGHLLNPDEPARRFQNFSQSDFSIYRGCVPRLQVFRQVQRDAAAEVRIRLRSQLHDL